MKNDSPATVVSAILDVVGILERGGAWGAVDSGGGGEVALLL